MNVAELPPVEPPPHVPQDRIFDFDIYNPPAAPDVHAAWKLLQAPGVPDVVWTPRNEGHWIVTRGKLISAAYEDHENFKTRIILVPKSVGEQHKLMPIVLDPPEHAPYRMLFNSSLSPKAIQALEDKIQTLADSLIEGLRERGSCNFTTEYAQVLPIQIFLDMCGLPLADAPRLKQWADQFTRPDGTMTLEEAKTQFMAYLEAPIAQRRATGQDDILGRLVNGKVHGEPLPHEHALAMTSLILLGGLDTVVNFLNFAMLFLARNPKHRQALVDDPSLIPSAIDELLRRFPLAASTRVVDRDVDFGGAPMKAGDMLVIPSALHGLDDRENDDPLEVDFNRAALNHSTFGAGPHRCPGSNLARAEIRITLETWLRKIPEFSVQDGATISYHGGVVAAMDALPLAWDPAKTSKGAA